MASLSTCHLGLWLGWQILLNLVKYDVAEVPMKVADVSIYISLQTRIRGSILHKTKLRDRGHDN